MLKLLSLVFLREEILSWRRHYPEVLKLMVNKPYIYIVNLIVKRSSKISEFLKVLLNEEGRRFFVYLYINVAWLNSVKSFSLRILYLKKRGSVCESVFAFSIILTARFWSKIFFSFQDFIFSPRLQFHILQKSKISIYK